MAYYIPNLSTLDSKKGIHALSYANPAFKLLKRIIVCLLLLVIGVNISVWSQNPFYSSGTFVVPVGVTKIKVECWGAGGGGGSTYGKDAINNDGGGGGGAYASSFISVTSGNSYPFIVGTGGAAGTAGGSSSFGNSTVIAAGGNGATNESYTAGVGGKALNSTGTITHDGGNGADGTISSPGAGGGGAGSAGPGGNASGTISGAGTSLFGGSGGATSTGAGSPGSIYGGGGGGSQIGNNGNKWSYGGSGANGLIVITIAYIDVTATSGTLSASYFTLKDAFDAINAGTHQGVITIKINGSTNETASAVLNASSGSASYSSILMYPTASGLSITGSIPGALIDLNGAANVTFNGCMNAGGSSSGMLTIINSDKGISNSTIRFINNAQNNTIQYCNLKGGSGSTGDAIILFGTGSNSGNTVTNCYITNNGTRRVNAIYSGTGSNGNTGNTISNNNIFDIWRNDTGSSMISLGTSASAWTISGNSFYERASFPSSASVEYDVIRIDNTSGNSFNVSGNYIGGDTTACSGTFTKTGNNNPFYGIYLNVGSIGASSVQNNAISNINYTNTGNASWTGIQVANGLVNIGTGTGNIIGAGTGASSIRVTNATTGGYVYGINISGTNSVTCNNNILGSITAASSNGTYAINFYGIYKASGAGTTTISNNLIGSTTTSNSINTSSTATANSQILYGIYSLGTGTTTISNNTIANLTDSTTETAQVSSVRGIFANAGSNNIDNNTVYNLKTKGLSNQGNNAGASLVGISLISNASGSIQNICNNTVYNLKHSTTSTTLKFEVTGIYYDGPTDVNNPVSRNFVHDFTVPSTSNAGSMLHGISLNAGSYTLSNNIVSIGNNISVGLSISGIWTNSTNTIKTYFNTVYLNGAAASSTSNTYAFQSLSCPASTDIQNNILWNGRTNSSGTALHFAISLNCQSNTTVNYNDYQFTQTFGQINITTYLTFLNWQNNTNPKLDANSSSNIDPKLVNVGGQQPSDYQVGVGSLTGTSVTGITTDFGGITRSLTAPTMGAWEFFSNPVQIWNGSTYGNYQTLKAAFDDINIGTYTGNLTILFKGNTTETATATLYQSGYNGKSNYTKIIVYPVRSGIIVKGTLAAPLVDLNGANNVIIDGRVNGTGSTNGLTFINNDSIDSTPGTSTFRFINSAGNDTIRYCNIKGSSKATTGGVVFFSTATTGIGNVANCIQNNNITSYTAINPTYSRPINAIYSAGTSSLENSGNVITDNNIYNFRHPGSDSYGINIDVNSIAFTISGNSFYETSSFAPTATANNYVIRINNPSGNSFVVSGNYIGGNGSLCTGTWTKTNAFINPFYAIYLNVGTTTASSIQGNTIKNITYGNSGAADWNGIYIPGGTVNVGTLTGNTIGTPTGTGSIAITNAATGGNVYGINIASTNTVDCENNSIGSITAANSNGANATNLYGIFKASGGGTTIITKNIIGSTSTSNSLNASSASSSNIQLVSGIHSLGTGTVTISDNTIANLTNSTTYSNVANSIYGIYSDGSTSCTITRNFVNNLNLAFPTSSINNTNLMIGINMVGSTVTCSNNIVDLNSTLYYAIYGIQDIGTSGVTKKIYHNTVYLSGGMSNSDFTSDAAFYKLNTTGTLDLRNNIFDNARSGGKKASHYAAYFQGGTLTVNYNDYFVSGITLPVVTGQDVNSKSIPPLFYSAGSIPASASDYKVNVSLTCDYLSDVPVDYGMSSRGTPTMGAWEMDPNKWKGAIGSMAWNTADNWTGGRVPPEYANIEFDAAPINHCYMNLPHTVNDIINTQSTYLLYTNGNKLTIKGNFNLTNGAQIDASAQGSSVEFAGVSTQAIASGTFNNNNVYDLAINNANNVTLNGIMNLLDTIASTSGVLDAVTNRPTVNYSGSTAQTINAGLYLNDKVYSLGINNPSGVTLKTGFIVNNLTISNGATLTIPVSTQLNVQETISNNAGASGLVIKAKSSAANGTLIFSGTAPLATVEMYSMAYKSTTADANGYFYKWQYFGIPINGVTASPTFDGSYVRRLDESGTTRENHWISVNNTFALQPGIGYELTQDTSKTIVFQGQLVNQDWTSPQLPYTVSTPAAAFPGQSILANPFTAAIDITKVVFGSDMQQSVWLYSTGSYGDWNTSTGTTSPGQYTVVLPGPSGLGMTSQIPSMQGMLVQFKSGITVSTTNSWVKIPYSAVIKNVEPQRVKRTVNTSSSDDVCTRIDVAGSRSSDKMWIFTNSNCTRNFDNGWDGAKMIGSALTPQIFAIEPDNNYQVDAVKDANNTLLGFQAGEDTEYTMTFTHQNLTSRYAGMFLLDLAENKTVDMTENGSTYSFSAESTPKPLKRFIVFTRRLENDSIETGDQLKVFSAGNKVFLQNLSNQNGEMQLYDMMGHRLKKVTFDPYGVTSIQVDNISGTYIVNATAGNNNVSEKIIIGN